MGIKALLDFHPKGSEKSKGMVGIKVQKSSQGDSRCFYMVKDNGQEEDFSAQKCLSAIEVNPPYVEPDAKDKKPGAASPSKAAEAKPAQETAAGAKPETEAKPAEEAAAESKPEAEVKPAEESAAESKTNGDAKMIDASAE